MTVTAIRSFDKKRSEVLTDEALRFVLYQTEIKKYGIREGEALDGETLREILTVLLPKRAKLRAMNLLKTRDYTRARLTDKLKEGGYPDAVVEEAVDYVASYRYIDDERYARDFIRGRMARASRMKIRGELLQRGIDAGTADAALEELYADDLIAGEDPEIAQIRRQIEKRHFDGKNATWEDRQRFLAAMARKGFSADKVRHVLEEDNS
ncbi:MAG: recombination regulator RecX [Lachnospiraceae bacterium]|nr:recombination regulator RecX [Lachnospiraceae bacterium]